MENKKEAKATLSGRDAAENGDGVQPELWQWFQWRVRRL